ncbi:MAG: dipeptidase [Gammaproteobacteria bacterium]|nr:dipeptidase [Gammaproteobacteria bacterium]MDH5274639.1 dipeptidase [Gammaproteobacteria bacterium]
MASAADSNFAARVDRILAATPLIDGHNDLPWELRARTKGVLASIDLRSDTTKLPVPEGGAPLMTDIPRLRAGHVGGQFWSVWVPTELKGNDAVQATLEQIDLVKRMVATYPADFQMAYTAADVRRIHRSGKIASLIGIEGGHQINNSLATLRMMHDLGARYMTLTHTRNTEWADSATDTPAHRGLTPFGSDVVREMNRLGMLVDLSHVSPEAMKAALAVAEAPVIFSHSSARVINSHPRNVPDDVLQLVAKNGGVVMVNFYPAYVSEASNQWEADYAAERTRYNSPPYAGLYIGQPERAKAALDAWEKAHPRPVVTLSEVADHVEHIRKVAGIDNVGIGSDFDGIEEVPQGLEGVDRYPALLAEMMRRGWTDSDVAKLAGLNVLRVMAQAEQVAARLQAARPASEALLQAEPRP